MEFILNLNRPQLCILCEQMTFLAQAMNMDAMQNSPSAQKFATRLHLLSLLAEVNRDIQRICFSYYVNVSYQEEFVFHRYV